MTDNIIARVVRLENEVLAIHTLLGENTRITAATKADTEAIISLYRGGILFSKVFMWLVVAASAVLSILTWFKGKL